MQALYDFTGEPGTAELSVTAGEVLTVTRQNVGEGWWEGVNQAGQTGLFPAAYVEVRYIYKHLNQVTCIGNHSFRAVTM